MPPKTTVPTNTTGARNTNTCWYLRNVSINRSYDDDGVTCCSVMNLDYVARVARPSRRETSRCSADVSPETRRARARRDGSEAGRNRVGKTRRVWRSEAKRVGEIIVYVKPPVGG